MSCLRSKRFANPVKDEHRNGFDKYTITGSCGCCALCNKTKQNDWLVRGYFEYISRENQTDWYFVTLDFDEGHLPMYNDIPCFDSELMSTFFESLRQSLPSFRYLYSTHYGEALHRPHYHVCFEFDKGSVSLDEFWSVVSRLWHYGEHSDIKQLRSVHNNPLAAIEYVTKYTTRDTRFFKIAKRNNLPKRYRPRTQASVGFGAQALDPSEFNSSRLLKEGIKFLDIPVITRDSILKNHLVYLDIKKDGILVPFAIPSYYMYKLCYVSSWDSSEKKTVLTRNSTFIDLQKIRHNANYVNLYKEFILSSGLPIHEDYYTSMVFRRVFPESPYNGMLWKDVVSDITQDKEKFYDFCKLYSWIEFDTRYYSFSRYRPKKYYYNNLEHPDLPGHYYKVSSLDENHLSWTVDYIDDSYDLYIQALSYYSIYRAVNKLRTAEFEDWKAQEETKKKIKEKCKNNLSYYWHLRHANFKFYLLNPSIYVSQYQIKED